MGGFEKLRKVRYCSWIDDWSEFVDTPFSDGDNGPNIGPEILWANSEQYNSNGVDFQMIPTDDYHCKMNWTEVAQGNSTF